MGKEKIKKEEDGQRKDIPTKTWMSTMLVRLQVGSKQMGEDRKVLVHTKVFIAKGRNAQLRQKRRYHKSIS